VLDEGICRLQAQSFLPFPADQDALADSTTSLAALAERRGSALPCSVLWWLSSTFAFAGPRKAPRSAHLTTPCSPGALPAAGLGSHLQISLEKLEAAHHTPSM
jgi:hypothetical protein